MVFGIDQKCFSYMGPMGREDDTLALIARMSNTTIYVKTNLQSVAGYAGWNRAWASMSECCECCALSNRVLSDGPITRPEEPCCMCVSLCEIRSKKDSVVLKWIIIEGHTKKERKTCNQLKISWRSSHLYQATGGHYQRRSVRILLSIVLWIVTAIGYSSFHLRIKRDRSQRHPTGAIAHEKVQCVILEEAWCVLGPAYSWRKFAAYSTDDWMNSAMFGKWIKLGFT